MSAPEKKRALAAIARPGRLLFAMMEIHAQMIHAIHPEAVSMLITLRPAMTAAPAPQMIHAREACASRVRQ
jgi:hypothetical protein